MARDRLVEAYARGSLRVDIEELIPGHLSKIDLLECLECELRWYVPIVSGRLDYLLERSTLQAINLV